MKPDAKQTQIPKLRFPEFQSEAAWRIEKTGDLFSDRQETGLPNLPLLSLTDKEGVIPQEDSNRKNNSNLDKSKYLRVVPCDIAYNTMRMWEGRSALVGIEGLVSPAYTVCKPKPETYSPFFAYYFKTSKLIEQFRKFSQGLVKDTLNLKYEAFSQIEVACPKFAEQQKIADCLSTLDERIGAESQKLDALKAHKKGLLQQLFPREGETLPLLRFPEFQNAPEWKEYNFKEVVSRSFYGTSQSTSEKGKYPVLRMGNMFDGQLDFTNLVYLDLDEAEFEKFRSRKGDILLNRTNSYDLVGKISLFDSEIECITASYIVTYRLKSELIDSRFCNYLLNTGDYQARIKIFATRAVSQANINPTTFQESLALSLPNPEEQHRIADCLSSLDDLITAQTDKLETLKTHKKSLMQKLFPTIGDH